MSNTIELAKGNYLFIYSMLTPEIQQHTRHQPCPICGGKDRFRLFNDWEETGGAICNQCGAGNGITWIMRLLGCNFREACGQLERILGAENVSNDYHQLIEASKQRRRQQQAKEIAMQPHRYNQLTGLLNDALPIEQSQPAINYLVKRGLGELVNRNDFPHWGALAALAYEGEAGKEIYPALVAPVMRKGKLVNVHRTYITKEGLKAPVQSAKKLMPSLYAGAMKGAAIPLYPCTCVVALAEGIETALAVRVVRPQLPVWATVSAHGMESALLPATVSKVYIMADLDRSGVGQKAALQLSKRLTREGREAIICIPEIPIPEEAKSVDWLDVLNSREVAA